MKTTFLGGGLGSKFEQDFISQAIQVALAVGRPVKLMWSREEDYRRDQYRPMAVIQIEASLDENQKVQKLGLSKLFAVNRSAKTTDIDNR